MVSFAQFQQFVEMTQSTVIDICIEKGVSSREEIEEIAAAYDYDLLESDVEYIMERCGIEEEENDIFI